MGYKKCDSFNCRKKAEKKNCVRVGKDKYYYCDSCFAHGCLYLLLGDDPNFRKRVKEITGYSEKELEALL